MDQGKVHFLNPTYCCGAAGCIDAFSDLYVASGEKRWLVAARKMADVMIQGFCDVGGRRVHATYDDSEGAEKEHPYVATGFMHGNAGIGFALLRLALLDTEGFDALVLPLIIPSPGCEHPHDRSRHVHSRGRRGSRRSPNGWPKWRQARELCS